MRSAERPRRIVVERGGEFWWGGEMEKKNKTKRCRQRAFKSWVRKK